MKGTETTKYSNGIKLKSTLDLSNMMGILSSIMKPPTTENENNNEVIQR